jgi:hypothetical protein
VPAPLPGKATRKGTNKAAPKNLKAATVKAVSKKAAQALKAPTDSDIVPAINGGGLIDRSEVADLVASAETGPVTGSRRVLRSRKGLDNAYQEAETQLTRALTAANKAQKERRAAAHLAL